MLNHTSEMCFYIAILGDDVPEVEEELRVVLLTISDGFVITTVIATVVIRDDDGESSYFYEKGLNSYHLQNYVGYLFNSCRGLVANA